MHLKELKSDPMNRRQHTPRNIGMIRDALGEVGAARSIVIDEDDVILAGNGVREAAAEAGITKVQVVEADGETVIAVRRRGLTPEQKRRLAMYDNRTAELATWNIEQLRADLGDHLALQPFFSEDELMGLMNGPVGAKGGLTDPDAIPQLKATDIQHGDLFELRRHRLLCGDSTKAEEVTRMMNGEAVDLVFTSPPYAQQRDYHDKISDWQGLMIGVFQNVPIHPRTQVLVNLGLVHRDNEWNPYWDGWIEWMRTQGWRRFGWYVWDQGGGLPGVWHGRFAPSHEFIFHFNRAAIKLTKSHRCLDAGKIKPAAKKGLRERDGRNRGYGHAGRAIQPWKIPDSVIRVTREYDNSGVQAAHPARFPVTFASEFIATFTLPGGVTYDPFCGSGTTVISAEQLGRRCYAVEISPQYVQLAIDRWEQFTGKKAVKVGEMDSPRERTRRNVVVRSVS